MQWYTHEPTKGLRCSACLEPFSRKGICEREIIPDEYELSILCVNKPHIAILFSHWCFIGSAYIICPVEPYYFYKLLYHIFQCGFHGMHLWWLRRFFSRVKNVDVCMKELFSRSIQFVPLLHMVCLATMWKTGILGGMAADVCIFLYYYELFDVLHTINTQQSFQFTNR
jgi:hypothetical protein